MAAWAGPGSRWCPASAIGAHGKGDYYRWESEECQERMLRRAHRWVGRVGNGLGRLLDLLGSLLGDGRLGDGRLLGGGHLGGGGLDGRLLGGGGLLGDGGL